ncbi:MAG: hypothetical protein IKO74_11680 [Selenomonadaceae bacterium]|nr:hypothetical protein [Selenomonadaceae bacterium]
MLINLVALLCGLAVFMILFLLRKYLARYHINLFHALIRRRKRSWIIKS